jgi:Family of unknown function (DUF6400)
VALSHMTPKITEPVTSVSTPESFTRSDCQRCAVASLVPFVIDLTVHESTRLAAVLSSLGPHWDPVEIYNGEAEAHRMLYAHLDPDQQATYDALIAAGALPDTPER